MDITENMGLPPLSGCSLPVMKALRWVELRLIREGSIIQSLFREADFEPFFMPKEGERRKKTSPPYS